MNALVLDETKAKCVHCGGCEAHLPALLDHFARNNNRMLFGDGWRREYGDLIQAAANSCHLDLLRIDEGIR